MKGSGTMGAAPGDENSGKPLTRKAGKIGNAGKTGRASKAGEAESAGNADKTLYNSAESSAKALDRVTVSAKSSANALGKAASSAAGAVAHSAARAAEGVSDASRNFANHASGHLTLIGRVYGVLVLLVGLVGVPYVGYAIFDGIHKFFTGRLHADPLDLTFLLTCAQAVVSLANAAALIVFGVMLLRDLRKHAAQWAYVLMAVTFVQGMLSLALQGLGPGVGLSLIQIAILVALAIALDPALIGERVVQRKLKRMDEHDEYIEAKGAGMLGRDPSGKGYVELNIFNVFWLFVVGCVGGLIVEEIYHLIFFNEWQDRAGLIWGPFSPIYGFGVVVLTMCLNRLWHANAILIFFASAIIGGCFESFVAWFMQIAFGIIAWNYSNDWLPLFGGKTCGKYMFFWGLAGLVWLRELLPRLLKFINLIPWKWRYALTAVMLVFMLIDIAVTLMAFDCWYGRIAGLPQTSPVARFFGEHFDNAMMQHRFQTMSINPKWSGRG
ncbi:putative ABC transporter permease [Bifidobacterium sp. ESL0784]|uniref:putative ABC transporter permease n=1 Tax=Bifidobacterium sp. ESL0784 TaxID=2983231 RepID=UPI0023F6BC91|nr:putative ABC transporter permease [Bifidobacterium sp. ESL0784]MDF7640139.1 putative ABC transporter permease [Bifidobacterium sp. ESL0784]